MKIDTNNGKYWDRAWSLVDGCTPCSPGCKHCWLAGMTHRFRRSKQTLLTDARGGFNGKVVTRPDRLNIPLRTRKPTVFAVWSDLFHEAVSAGFITQAFSVMAAARQHTFLICTKRPERINSVLYGPEGIFYLGGGDYLSNVWLGTTVENQEQANKRLPHLRGVEVFHKFLSIEPMLSGIDLKDSCGWIDGVVLGGETGSGARPLHIDWVQNIRDQCRELGVPFFLKHLNKKDGRILDGRTHDDLPWR